MDPNEITEESLDTSSYLDKMLLKSDAEPAPEPEVKPEPETKPEPEVKPEPETKPEPEVKVEPEVKPTALDEVTLPAHARGSTAKAFEDLKTKAKAELTQRETEIAELRKQLETAPKPEALAELDTMKAEKAKLESELAELRQFRENLAAQGDPVFESRFDKPIATIDEEMYARLRQVNGYTPEMEAKIKELGGFQNIDLDKIGASVGTSLRRFIDNKLAMREDLVGQRDKALSNASESRKKFVEAERAKLTEEEKSKTARRASKYEGYISGVEKFKTVEVPKDADEATRKRIEATNTFIREKIEAGRKLAAEPLSEAQQAELGAVYVYAHLASAENAVLAGTVKQHEAKIAELEAKVAAFKKAGSTVRRDARPAGEVKVTTPTFVDASTALDNHFSRKS